MAREESDREDLLREATALVERIELQTDTEPLVVGFRATGAVSFFFGSDPVYQFNAAGELRRAYREGRLFKAVRGQLASLRRVRQRDAVELHRHDLTPSEQEEFLASMRDRLHRLAALLSRGQFRIVGQVPADAAVLHRVRHWLATHPNPHVARAPKA